jgi:AcrR family transcriptional regulator
MTKPLRSQPTRDRIREVARRLFGEQGYERTTIRAVAAEAKIHPSMVMRYYGSKEGLFAAAAEFNLALPDLTEIPREDVGRSLVRHFLKRWEAPGEELPALLLVAVTHPQARVRLIEIFRDQIAPAIAAICDDGAATRAALIATQMLGLALTRYVLRLPPVVDLPDEIIVDHVGATVQAYVTKAVPGSGKDGRLGQRASGP